MAATAVFGPEPPPAQDSASAHEPVAPPKAKSKPDPNESCLLWGDDVELDPEHPEMAALLALQEECTPSERAEALKVCAIIKLSKIA